MTRHNGQSERLRVLAMEDVEEAVNEASLAKRALAVGDVIAAAAKRRLSRVVGLVTDASSALLILQLEGPIASN